MSLAVTGHENKLIKIFDTSSMKLIHQCIAHHDAVTSISMVDFKLFTGSHDGSLRVWDLRNMKLLNSVDAHQTKYDEGLHSFDIEGPLMATCGADSLINVFNIS